MWSDNKKAAEKLEVNSISGLLQKCNQKLLFL